MFSATSTFYTIFLPWCSRTDYTPVRLRGLAAMLACIKRQVREQQN
jgi:sulfur transfer protein SufE